MQLIPLITSCGASGWTRIENVGDAIDAIACPFTSTMGAMAIVFVGFIIFAGLAVYSRQATMPAVVAVIFVGIGATVIPTVAAWWIMRYVIVVAAILLLIILVRLNR